jgi:DNA-binding MarR family transcriptional regulator
MTAYSPKQDADRLLQLSNEVSRIAGSLAQLSARPRPASLDPLPDPSDQPSPVSADSVMEIVRARRLRSRFFADDLFADPAWDMLLDLFHAELMQRRVSVSTLCEESGVPPTTGLRWLTAMVERGLFVRRADPNDRRRFFVELAPAVSEAMKQYVTERAELLART